MRRACSSFSRTNAWRSPSFTSTRTFISTPVTYSGLGINKVIMCIAELETNF